MYHTYLVQENVISFGEYPTNEIVVVEVAAADDCPIEQSLFLSWHHSPPPIPLIGL